MGAELFVAVCLALSVLILLPLSWHIRTRNIPTISLLVWCFLSTSISGVLSWIWTDNVIVRLEVFCDIALPIKRAVVMGTGAALLCIARRLENIASPRSPNALGDDRQQRIYESLLCIGLPLLYTLSSYIIQTNRFYIIEDVGCFAPLWMSWPGLLIGYTPVWITTMGIITYAFVTGYWFILRRAQFVMVLGRSGSGMSKAQFTRLMVMISFLGLANLASLIYFCATQIAPLSPWINWDFVHGSYDAISQFPRAYYSQSQWNSLWIAMSEPIVASAVVFFFYGTGGEAVAEYKKWAIWVRKVVLREDRRSARKPKGAETLESSHHSKPHSQAHTLDTLGSDSGNLSQGQLGASTLGDTSYISDVPSMIIHTPHDHPSGPKSGAPARSKQARWAAGDFSDGEDDEDEDEEEDSGVPRLPMLDLKSPPLVPQSPLQPGGDDDEFEFDTSYRHSHKLHIHTHIEDDGGEGRDVLDTRPPLALSTSSLPPHSPNSRLVMFPPPSPGGSNRPRPMRSRQNSISDPPRRVAPARYSGLSRPSSPLRSPPSLAELQSRRPSAVSRI